jgi:hypothetical protein
VPAECDVETASGPCGVLAVGRCSTCGRAFCGSHRALSFADWCEPCRRARLAATAAEGAQREADRADAFADVARAARALAERGVPAEEIVHREPVWGRNLLGRGRWRHVERPTGIRAWRACAVEVERFGKTHPKHDSEWIRETWEAWVDTEGHVRLRKDGAGWVPIEDRANVRVDDLTATLRTVAASLRSLQ